MFTDTQHLTDPIEILERLDVFLAHMAGCHVAGLAWGGVPLTHQDILGPPPRRCDPGQVLGVPRAAGPEVMQRDIQSLRRLLALVGARLRYGSDRRQVTLALAEGMMLAREATTVSAMRTRMLDAVLTRLRHARRDVVRRIGAIGSVDIRLDAWVEVGHTRRTAVRAYLDGVLQQQSDFASHGRGSLGALVESRRQLDVAADRIEARVRGEHPRIARTDTGPLVFCPVVSEPTPPAGHHRVGAFSGHA